MRKILSQAARWFLAGVLALLPVVITVAVVAWVADFLRGILGRDTVIGEWLRRVGLHFASDATLAYLLGVIIVLAVIVLIGMLVEAGARKRVQRLFDVVLGRIPLLGSIYGTSRQLVAMLDQNDDDKLKGMQAVFCFFGKENASGVLALLVSPERFRINGRDYQIVVVPTAPVPIGGGLLFVPADLVQPSGLSVEKLMSIYVSMGVTAAQFLPTSAGAVQQLLTGKQPER